MLRQRENKDSFKAGVLSVGVHAILLLALLISFNWKTTHPMNVAEVELWDSLPNIAVTKPLPEPVIKPEPVVKEEPKPEPKPIVEEKPKEEPKVDIALEKKKKELELKKVEEKLKADQALEQKKKLALLQEQTRLDDLHDKEKLLKDNKAKAQKDALKQIQQDMAADARNADNQQALGAKAAANAGIVAEFQNKIRTKIRGNVNKTLCGDGNPELKFDIGLLPTGELNGNPKLVKSSGSPACDEAVERAIMASEPLPLPSDSSLFSQFRNLKLTFRPNDGG
ncbi:MAG: energy transducer TonB [Pseudomonadota bacterium]